MLLLVAISIVLAFLLAVGITPLVRHIARAGGLVDHPDRDRKLQAEAVALGGGVAVFVSLALGFALLIGIDRTWFGHSLGDIDRKYYHLFASGAALLIVGLVDDLWNLRGRQKLLLQCLIVTILVSSGTRFDSLGILGYDVQLGVFAFPVSILWLLIAVNALNLIDGADGMASTIGAIICLGLGWVSFQSNSPFNGFVCFSLAGALLGFLVFNKPPATIYLGDAGSMMIGLFIGVFSVWANFKETTVLSSAPIAIFALPLLDSSAAIVRRWLTGRSIYATDRGHLHHLLLEKYGNRRMLVLVSVLCATTTLLAVLSVRLNIPLLSAIGVAIVLSMLVLTRSFGHAETRLLFGRAAGFAHSFTVAPYKVKPVARSREVNLQGSGPWATVWDPLVEFASSNGWARLQIDLNLAWLHEGYHASWRNQRMPEKSKQLSLALPLFAHRRGDGKCVQIGRLQVIAPAGDSRVYDHIGELSDYLQSIAPDLDGIVGELERNRRETQEPGPSVPALPSPAAVVGETTETVLGGGRSRELSASPTDGGLGF